MTDSQRCSDADTTRAGLGLARRSSRSRNPGDLGRRPRHRARRAGERTGASAGRDDHARPIPAVPPRASSRSQIEERAARQGRRRSSGWSAASRRPGRRTWISAEGRQQLTAYGIAPPPDESAGTGLAAEPARRQARDGRMPALRVGAHRAGQRVRLDAVQGAVPVPGLPGAVRLLQVHLAETTDRTGELSNFSVHSRESGNPGLPGQEAHRG